MEKMEHDPASRRCLFFTFLFVPALYFAWIGAWLLELTLQHRLKWMGTLGAQTLYWTLAKLIVWVFPAIVLICYSGRRVEDVIGLGRVKSIAIWGCGAGLLLGIVALAQRAIYHHSLFSLTLNWSFLSGVIISPVVEEITFRGAILGNLVQRYRFRNANTMTAVFFVGAHLPGWYFQGRLSQMMVSPFGALSVFLLGWIFGFVAYRSKSTTASTLTHILNNLANA
jgi:membrane protease YdiL (CAAX protease family)